MKRRSFLKMLGSASCVALVSKCGEASATSGEFHGYPDENGVLHDTTLCIGCRRCEEACANVNSLPKQDKPFDDKSVFNTKRRTSAKVWTVVNKYQIDENVAPVYRKTQCMHCKEPACASACFVKAFKKNPDGSVTYDPSLCVGCRYCMVACPFNIPGYTYDKVISPVVQKCTMCHNRQEEGKIPGCVEACPTGALIFGRRDDLLKIAHDRISKHPDRYINHIYGEKEMGGTNWLTISATPFGKLGLDEGLGTKAAGEYTAGTLGAVPMVVGMWTVVLGGAYAITKRKEQVSAEEQAEAVASALSDAKTKADAELKVAVDKAVAAKTKEMTIAVKKAREEGYATGKQEAEAVASQNSPSNANDGKKEGE